MKNILLATSILALSASAAFADMKVEVGGHVNSYAASVKQARTYKNLSVDGTDLQGRDSKHATTFHFLTEGEISVKASDTADTGLGYGAEVVINTDNTDNTIVTDSADNTYDETRNTGDKLKMGHAKLFVSTDMGKVEFGGAKSASNQMKTKVPTLASTGAVASVTGAVDGDYTDLMRIPGYYSSDATDTAKFITSPNLPSSSSSKKRYANKLVFMTPKLSGFQFGISYIPNLEEKGTYNGMRSKFEAGDYRNIVNGVLTFEHEFDGIKLDASVSGEMGDTAHAYAANGNPTRYRDLGAWEGGLKLAMDQFALGGVYGSHGKSGKLKVPTPGTDRDYKRTSYWAAGLTYENNGLGLGVNTFQGSRDGNKTRAYGFSADYMLAKGLVTYADLTFFKLTPYGTGVQQLSNAATPLAEKNKGHVLLVGAKVNF